MAELNFSPAGMRPLGGSGEFQTVDRDEKNGRGVKGSGEFPVADAGHGRRRGPVGRRQQGQGGSAGGGKAGVAELFPFDVQGLPQDNFVGRNVIAGVDTYSGSGESLTRSTWNRHFNPLHLGKQIRGGGFESEEEAKPVNDYRLQVALNSERWKGTFDQVELARGRYNGPTANVPMMIRV